MKPSPLEKSEFPGESVALGLSPPEPSDIESPDSRGRTGPGCPDFGVTENGFQSASSFGRRMRNQDRKAINATLATPMSHPEADESRGESGDAAAKVWRELHCHPSSVQARNLPLRKPGGFPVALRLPIPM